MCELPFHSHVALVNRHFGMFFSSFFPPGPELGPVQIHAVPTMPGIAPSVISVSNTAKKAEKTGLRYFARTTRGAEMVTQE